MSNLLQDKIKFKMYFRYILYIDYTIQKIKQKTTSLQSKTKEMAEKDQESILQYYFKNTLNKNKLANAADMYLIQPYFQNLCKNSYDSTCNEYYNYINTLTQNNEKYNKNFATQLIQQFDDFTKKMHGLSLQEQQINQLKTLFANAGADNIDSERFHNITEYIQSELNYENQQQNRRQVQELDKDIDKKREAIETLKEEYQRIEKAKEADIEKEETKKTNKQDDLEKINADISNKEIDIENETNSGNKYFLQKELFDLKKNKKINSVKTTNHNNKLPSWFPQVPDIL